MANSRLTEGKKLLEQARKLLSQVQENIRTQRWGSDDVCMQAYNDLIEAAANLIPEDPILNGQMVKMPDAYMLTVGGEYLIRFPETTYERTKERLTRLINRLEILLGEEPAQQPSDDTERIGEKKKFYEEGSLLHAVALSLDKIKKLSKSESISEKLLAFNIIIFVLLASLIISHLFIGADSILSLAGLFLFTFSFLISCIASIIYANILETIVNLAADKIGSLRIGAIILLIGLPIASAGLAFNIPVLITVASGIIGLQIVFMLLGALLGFPNLGIDDRKVKPGHLREVIGDVTSVLTIIGFIITICLLVIGVL